MAKSRRSSKSTLQQVGGITAGIAAGAIGVPKIVEMIDKEGKLDSKIVNGVGAVGAYWFSRKQKGFVQSMLQGLSAGLAWNVLSDVAGMKGIGWQQDYSSDFNYVAGAGTTSRANPGVI